MASSLTTQGYDWEGDKLSLRLLVQPRASRDEWLGVHGKALRVRITAPPVDGKANKHLIAYLARLFGVSKTRISLISGDTGRHKHILILSPQTLPDGISSRTKS